MHYQHITVVVEWVSYLTLFCAHSFSLSLDIVTLRSHSPFSVSVLPLSAYDVCVSLA